MSTFKLTHVFGVALACLAAMPASGADLIDILRQAWRSAVAHRGHGSADCIRDLQTFQSGEQTRIEFT